jgi:hypothetical protein
MAIAAPIAIDWLVVVELSVGEPLDVAIYRVAHSDSETNLVR